VRFIVALTMGLRQGEALGLKWDDIDIQWGHGCAKNSKCGLTAAKDCPLREIASATLTVRRPVQQFGWQHGCPVDKPCGRKYGAHCAYRHGGGVVTTDVKSRAGRRTVGIPHLVALALERHRERQAAERIREEGWVFANRLGAPVHPTVDYEAWKALLRQAKVHPARLHDAVDELLAGA
jgi:integrase